ncbi:MAG: DUF4424 domain-containing protein [Verrucomicrobia bacterium]|nr:MAG: DUF4424 domain-containing protein [Verrucomicrobiota bacterium]
MMIRSNQWLNLGIALALIAPNAFANGGGYFRGGVEQLGDISGFEPQQTEHIRILDEKLAVALGPRSADVEVRYLMRNETDQKVKVRFGFPVEESFDSEMGDVEPDASAKVHKQLIYCQNYAITASGKEIAATWQEEKNATNERQFKGIAGWLISEITFTAGEEKSVMIKFVSSYPSESWSVSDDTSKNASLFRYRLSSAACWAGTIGTGRITLKPVGIDPKELKVLKPVNRFKKEGDSWVWNFENLEPTLADDLEIEAQPEIRTYARTHNEGTYVERGGVWLISHINYQIKASSFLPPAGDLSYEPEKVKNLWGQDAWSEGAKGSGIGEWLEITPEVPKPLNAIEIEPGMTKDEKLFKANARPKNILVELNGEKRFNAQIPDSRDVHRILIHDYTKPVKKIRLTFEEVWPGSQFEDLCVSGIRLQAKLDKKPKIEAAR